MNRIFTWCKQEWLTLVIIAIATSIQIFLVTRPFTFLLNNLLTDDVFFYFKIARNIVEGVGPTFDGINPTNGFHPMWLVILLGIFKIFPVSSVADTGPIVVSLYMQVVMNVITAFFVARILARFTTNTWIRAFGMIVWALNPFLLYEAVNGLETSLTLMLFSIFFLLALRIEESRPIGQYYLVGAIAGFMIIARIDMVFYFIAFLLWILARKGWKQGWLLAFGAGVCASPPVLAWFAWNYANFHMIMTSASQSIALVHHQLIIQDHDASWGQFFKAIVYSTQYELDHYFRRTGMYALGSALLGAFAALVLYGGVVAPKRLREVTVSISLFFGWVAMFIADASIRWTARDWYFVSFGIFLAIVSVVVLNTVLPHIKYKRVAIVSIIALTLFSFYVNWSKSLQPSKHILNTQYQLREMSEWMNENLPPGSIIGSFSPGIQGYFSTLYLVDLDGLVNNSAYEALKKKKLWQYVKDQNITYLAMYDTGINYRYKSFWGEDPHPHLTLVRNFFGDPPDGLQLYKVR